MNVEPKTTRQGKKKVDVYKWNERPPENAKLRWLPVDKLEVDHTYQRQALQEKQVLNIAANFNWAFFGALVVKQRGNQFFVIDGQHRLSAVKRRGDIRIVPCSVTDSAGIEDEARAFVGTNSSRKNVSAYDKYRAMIAAGDPLYCDVDAMIARHGWVVRQNAQVCSIAFPTLLVKTYATDSGTCEEALLAQKECCGEHEHFLDMIHKGLFYILAADDYSDTIWQQAKKVYRRGGKALIEQSIRKMMIETGACASMRLCGLAVAGVFNHNLRSNRIEL